MSDKKISLVDDDYESIGTLFRLRAPSLFAGLILGIGISFVISGFKEVLSKNIELTFFMPFIVYIADAIGTQTEAIYSRKPNGNKSRFGRYLHKELILGLLFGLIFSISSWAVVIIWLNNDLVALTVSISSFITVATAPITALLVAHFFQSFKKDPAAGTGPIATVLQDMISIVIFGIVASTIML